MIAFLLPFNGIRAFLCLFNLALFLRFSIQFRNQLQFFKSQSQNHSTGKIFRVIKIPALTARQFVTVGYFFLACLVFSCFGFHSYYFVGLSLICYFLYFGQILSLGYVMRKTNVLVFIFIILLISPGLNEPLQSSGSDWPLFLIKVSLALVYFSSACTKIKESGLKWIGGENLQANLAAHYLMTEQPSAWVLAQAPTWCSVLTSAVFVFELTFPIILFFPQLTPLYIVFGLAFHGGVAKIMGIEYTKYFCLIYLVFFVEIVGWGINFLSGYLK